MVLNLLCYVISFFDKQKTWWNSNILNLFGEKFNLNYISQ